MGGGALSNSLSDSALKPFQLASLKLVKERKRRGSTIEEGDKDGEMIRVEVNGSGPGEGGGDMGRG